MATLSTFRITFLYILSSAFQEEQANVNW